MADAPNQNALMKYGAMGAWIGGALVAILCVALAVLLGDTDTPKRNIDGAVSKINSRLQDPKPSEPPREFKAKGTSGADKNFGTAKGGKITPKQANEHLLLDFPVQIKIFLAAPPTTDDFDGCDVDPQDGKLSSIEYQNSAKFKAGIKFKTLQQDNDKNYLSRAEYDSNPKAVDIEFDNLDTNDDGKLSREEFERNGKTGFEDKDINPKDNFISREEFGAGPVGPKECDLAAVSEVTATADPKAFTITVKWAAPTLKNPPADLVYVIERYSPGDVAERKARYTKELAEQRNAERKWDDDFKAWQKLPGNEAKTKKDYEKDHPKPVRPPEPTEWARMQNFVPGTETQYVDSDFTPNFTYKYRVCAATAADTKLAADVKLNPKQDVESKKISDWSEQTNRPVIIYNRVEMAWASKGATTAKIRLTKFHRIDGKWMPVEVVQELNLGDDLGSVWSVADIKAANFTVQVLGADGKNDAAALKALESMKAPENRIDFGTGWQFNGFQGSDFILTLRGGTGKSVLPKDTNKPATEAPMDPSSMPNPIGIRIAAIDPKAETARLELTRWKQIGTAWYRVVIYQEVKKGDDIGMDTDAIKKLTGAVNKDIFFYDAGGAPVTDKTVLAQLWEISAVTGLKYGGIDKRTVDLGGGKMDIFGTYYVDK